MNLLLAAAAAALCVAVFWLLAVAIGLLVPSSAIDPAAGMFVGVVIAVPVYRSVIRRR